MSQSLGGTYRVLLCLALTTGCKLPVGGGGGGDAGGDIDSDGDGDVDSDGDGFVSSGDCDDSNASIHPDAEEVCDGIDNDCDASVDSGAIDAVDWYADDDGDGYGNKDAVETQCTQPPDMVADDTDCNDMNAAVNPGATEVCNSMDDDCDGVMDIGASDAKTFYADADKDGYGDADGIVKACFKPMLASTDNTDCEDSDSTTYPGAAEACDGNDNDCDGVADNGAACAASFEPNTLVGNNGVTLTQLPLFEGSSFASFLQMFGSDRLMCLQDTGLFTRDLNDSASPWVRFTNFDGYRGINLGGDGVSSAVPDPANPDTVYFCSGSVSLDSDTVDYNVFLDLGQLYRSTDGLASATQVGGDTSWERLVLACPGRNHARYIIEPGTDIEMWYVSDRNNLFAFDDRETVSADGATVSRTVYFMTYDQGLARGTYNAAGSDIDWDIIHKEPIIYDTDLFDGGSYGGAIYSNATLSNDQYIYEYAPQEGSDDERSRYAEVNGTCNLTVNGRSVVGDWNASEGMCVEDEQHGIGACVAIDPIFQQYNSALGDLNRTVLYAGYMTQPVWPHGGLFRLQIDTNRTVSEQELTYAGIEHLDVRDIAIDGTEMVSVAGTGEVARYFYVAAGRDGAFKGEVDSNGSVTLTALNSGLVTRTDYVDDYAACGTNGTACGDTISYQYSSIEQTYVAGTSYLLLSTTTSDTMYWAIEDFSGAIAWSELSGFSDRVQGGVIDAVRAQVYVSGQTGVQSLPLADIASASPTWSSFGDWGERGSLFPVYDPTTDDLVHMPDLDGTYGYVSWDSDYNAASQAYAKDVRDVGTGLCYGAYYVDDPTTYDVDGDYELNATEKTHLGTALRYNSYGIKMLFGPKTGTSEYYAYVPGTHAGYGTDGAVYRGEWNATDGEYHFVLATGDKECKAVYTYGSTSNERNCAYLCDSSASAGALPAMPMGHLAVDPQDGAHLMLIGSYGDSGTFYFYESLNAGDDWTDLSSQYVYSASAVSLAGLGRPWDLMFDPQNSDILYVAWGDYGVFMYDATLGYFEDISDVDLSADNNVSATTLPSRGGATYTLLGAAKYKVPELSDLEVAIDPGSGTTRLYITAAPFCDQGYGVYPYKSCTTTNGGGVYTKLVGETVWQKLNDMGDPTNSLQYFMAYKVAVSPVDPDVMVVAGFNDHSWGSGGNPGNITAGLIYTLDGGATWQRATDSLLNVNGVGAHPTDPTRFVFSIFGWGLWELQL